MKAWAYTLVHNERLMVEYWIRHYAAFCERVIVYDEQSDDGTREIAQSMGAEVRDYAGNGHLDDFAFVNFANQQYKEARRHADWVVWTDADEFVYHPRIAERLSEFSAQGVTLPRTIGYSMLALSPPSGSSQIWEQIQVGIPVSAYAKVAVLNPEIDIVWTAGKHTAHVYSEAKTDDGTDPLKLLHYRWLGREYFVQRNQRNFERISEANGNGRETYPGFFGELSPEWYEGQIELAKVVT